MKKLTVYTMFALAAVICFSCNGDKKKCGRKCKTCAQVERNIEVSNSRV